MSEFSESYHLFTKEIAKAYKTLSSLGLNGYLFNPKTFDHWCTFVPFESCAFSPAIAAKALNSPVLAYHYAEDHGWAAQLAFEDDVRRYSCSWEEKVQIHADEDFFDKVHDWLNVEINNNVKHLLASTDFKTVLARKPAYEFCQALGLEYFDWLSPQYLVLDLDEYKKRKDAKLVGNIPESAVIDQPCISKISLEKSDLSALKAVEVLTPHIKQWAEDAKPDFISMKGTYGRGALDLLLTTEGRLTAHGAWRIRYISPSKQVLLWVALFSSGDVHIDAMKYKSDSVVHSWDLSGNKFDSPDVIQHALQEYVPEYKQGININNLVLSLREWSDQLSWEVRLVYRNRLSSALNRRTWVLAADSLKLLWKNDR